MAKNIYSKRQQFVTARLIEAREEKGLTQVEVSKTKLVSQSQLSKIENGQRKIEFLTLLDLARFYEKEITFFTPPKSI